MAHDRNKEIAATLLAAAPFSLAAALAYAESVAKLNSLIKDQKVERIERRSHKWLREGDRCTKNFFKPFKVKKTSIIAALRSESDLPSSNIDIVRF